MRFVKMICAIMAVSVLTGCGKVPVNEEFVEDKSGVALQDDNLKNSKESGEEKDESAKGMGDEETNADAGNGNLNSTDQIENNGGLYVSYNGNVYYRRYHAKNFEKTGIWEEYQNIPGTPNNMMVLNTDGSRDIAFEDTGFGAIYLYNNRFFLQKVKDDKTVIYSLPLDGTDLVEIGSGTIEGIDEENGILVYSNWDEQYKGHLFALDCTTLESREYEISNPCSQFLTIHEGAIYYMSNESDSVEETKPLKICKVAINDINENVIATVPTDIYEFSDGYFTIPCFQIVDQTMYFAYGMYAGSGNFYQGGAIGKLTLDDNQNSFEKIDFYLEDKQEDISNILADTFLIEKNGETTTLYFNVEIMAEENNAYQMDILTGEITASKMKVEKQNTPFVSKNSVFVYKEGSLKPFELIPEIRYSLMGELSDAYSYAINDIQQCGEYVYYQLQASKYNSEASIGWRDGYTRIKTIIARSPIGMDDVEILYEY